MTDDIVTRLRMCESEYGSGDVCKEAADEIERLRQRLKMSETRAERWRARAEALGAK